MDFNHFCIIVLGKVNGVKDEIRDVSTLEVNFVEHKNIVISTFSTVLTVSELKEFFTEKKRGYFLFELGDDNYAVDVGNDNIYKILFGKFEGGKLSDEISRENFFRRIKDDEFIETNQVKIEEETIDINALTPTEKQELINSIIDKGFENFTKKDKELLSKLTKEG